MSSPSTKKRSLEDVFQELSDIKNQIHLLNNNILSLNNKFQSDANSNKKPKTLFLNSKATKEQFESNDEKILQLLMMAVLYSSSQIGVSSNDEDQDLRHALGILIPRSCCLFFQNTNQHVAQQKEKFEIVIYVYDKESNLEIPTVNFVTNVRIIQIKSIVKDLFEQNNAYSSTLFILIVRSGIDEFSVLQNHKNLAIISLLDSQSTFPKTVTDEKSTKIIFMPQMFHKFTRLIRYVVYFIVKNAQINTTIILEEIRETFQKVDSSSDFSKGVIALYSPLFASVLSSFLELKTEWKHLSDIVFNSSNNESRLTNQAPWSKIWKTNREFLSHLSLNEFLKTYDSKYQPGTNERSKFVSPNIVSTLFCDYTDKHEAKNFIFIPMSTISQLLKNSSFKKEFLQTLNEITPELIQHGYTRFPHRKTFDFQKLPDKIANCLIDDSIFPDLNEYQTNKEPPVPSTPKTNKPNKPHEDDFTDWCNDDQEDQGFEDSDVGENEQD